MLEQSHSLKNRGQQNTVLLLDSSIIIYVLVIGQSEIMVSKNFVHDHMLYNPQEIALGINNNKKS